MPKSIAKFTGKEEVEKDLETIKKHMTDFKSVFNKVADDYFKEQRKQLSLKGLSEDGAGSKTNRDFLKSITDRKDPNAVVKISKKRLTIDSRVKTADGTRTVSEVVAEDRKAHSLRDTISAGSRRGGDKISYTNPEGKEVTTTGRVEKDRILKPAPIKKEQIKKMYNYVKEHATTDLKKKLKRSGGS